MHDPLVIKRPGKQPLLREAAVIAAIALPVLCIIILILRGIDLHFDNAFLNLCAHALVLFVMPVLFEMYSRIQPEFMDNGETILADMTYLSSFRYTWWMLLMIWPAFLLGVFIVLNTAISSLVSGSGISTSGWTAAGIFVVSLLIARFYSNLITMRQQIRVSDRGLRAGFMFFIEWDMIDNVSRYQGAYEVYLKTCPKLPFSNFTLEKSNASVFEDFLARHNVSQSNVRHRFTSVVKICVAAGAFVILAAGIALYMSGLLGPVAALAVTFIAGIFATQILEKARNIKALTQVRPVIEPAEGATTRLNPNNIPDTLRDLVPLAEKWGTADLALRSYNRSSATREEKLALKSGLDGRTTEISDWVESFNDISLSEEAEFFKRMIEEYNKMKLWLMPED